MLYCYIIKTHLYSIVNLTNFPISYSTRILRKKGIANYLGQLLTYINENEYIHPEDGNVNTSTVNANRAIVMIEAIIKSWRLNIHYSDNELWIAVDILLAYDRFICSYDYSSFLTDSKITNRCQPGLRAMKLGGTAFVIIKLCLGIDTLFTEHNNSVKTFYQNGIRDIENREGQRTMRYKSANMSDQLETAKRCTELFTWMYPAIFSGGGWDITGIYETNVYNNILAQYPSRKFRKGVWTWDYMMTQDNRFDTTLVTKAVYFHHYLLFSHFQQNWEMKAETNRNFGGFLITARDDIPCGQKMNWALWKRVSHGSSEPARKQRRLG